MFNNTEVDGRIIEVRHDKMGWLLTLLAEQVSYLICFSITSCIHHTLHLYPY